MLSYVIIFYNVACACSRYNVRSYWLIVTEL